MGTSKVKKKMVTKSHLVSRQKQYGCDLCEKSYKSLKQLQSHIQQKHEEKNKYKCAVDLKRLKLHNEVKHSQKRYSCQNCEFVGNNKTGLKCHISAKHKVSYPSKNSGEQSDFKFNPDLKIIYDSEDDKAEDEKIEDNENGNIEKSYGDLYPDLKIVYVSENEEDEDPLNMEESENVVKKEPVIENAKDFMWMPNNSDKTFVKREISKKTKKDLGKKINISIYKGLKIST